MSNKTHRYNHTIYCNEEFKETLNNVCSVTGLSPSSLVKAILLFSTEEQIINTPIDIPNDDRNTIILSNGRAVKRRPRVQVILSYKLDTSLIYKALTLACSGIQLQNNNNDS